MNPESQHATSTDPQRPVTGAADAAAPEETPADGAEPTAPAATEEPDWKDLALRKAVELENTRKQTAQRVQKATRDGMRRIALELLPALDDFDRALGHA